jgi:hypothetical protein
VPQLPSNRNGADNLRSRDYVHARYRCGCHVH